VEQTAAAASAMKDQARTLAEEVARFRLPDGAALARAAATVNVTDFDFDKGIEAHRQWKVKLRRAIEEREQLDAETICRDDRCPLGQWIHGVGGAQWSGRPPASAGRGPSRCAIARRVGHEPLQTAKAPANSR
jgi:methyl-accepting chemotaxis protein